MDNKRMAPRKLYTSPTLKKFGSIKDLNRTKLAVAVQKTAQ